MHRDAGPILSRDGLGILGQRIKVIERDELRVRPIGGALLAWRKQDIITLRGETQRGRFGIQHRFNNAELLALRKEADDDAELVIPISEHAEHIASEMSIP